MKRIFAIVLAIIMMLILSSCGNHLKGTYVANDFVTQTFTFRGNKITMTAFGIAASGTYKIKNGKIYITYDMLGSEHTMSQSFDKSGRSLIIGGTEFIKQ